MDAPSLGVAVGAMAAVGIAILAGLVKIQVFSRIHRR